MDAHRLGHGGKAAREMRGIVGHDGAPIKRKALLTGGVLGHQPRQHRAGHRRRSERTNATATR